MTFDKVQPEKKKLEKEMEQNIFPARTSEQFMLNNLGIALDYPKIFSD